MKYILSLLTIFLMCAPSLREQIVVELKSKSTSFFVPKPFVLCYKNKHNDTASANIIAGYIKTKMDQMVGGKFKIESYEFSDYDSYLNYGKELSHLIADLENEDMEKVQLPLYFKDLTNSTLSDLCVFVFTLADPKSKKKIIGSAIASVAVGATIGSLTGFAPVLIPNMVSSKMHVIVYSKSKNQVISYEDEEDKDDPLIEANTFEQFETLFSDFVDAGKVN